MRFRQLLPLIGALFSLYIIWGSTYFVIRIGVESWPPLMMAGIRFLSAGVLLLAFLLLRGHKLPPLRPMMNAALIGMLLLAGVLRMVMTHHTTFFINSLAHIWGSQPFTDRNSARDNGILAFFTFGEGYHNFHHLFENDYRNGIQWWQFDPTKWLIRTAAWCGLAKDLRSCPEERIEQAKRDWDDGRFGLIPGDDVERIPLPER